MLLRNSISTTKRFFQKTIHNVKSFLSKGNGTYERLPKTPAYHPITSGRDHVNVDIEAGGYRELDNFYVEFTHQWDSNKSKLKNKAEKSTKKSQEFYTNPPKNENLRSNVVQKADARSTPVANHEMHGLLPPKQGEAEKQILRSNESYNERKDVSKNKSLLNVCQGMKKSELCSKSVRERRLNLVVQKLKDLELLDKGNVEHKLDVQKVIHYYSRLTCPPYLDIVDKFFAEICSEFFGPKVSPLVNMSKPTL